MNNPEPLQSSAGEALLTSGECPRDLMIKAPPITRNFNSFEFEKLSTFLNFFVGVSFKSSTLYIKILVHFRV